ncbi:MAG: type II toxin-antitoxin system HicB family antitoxin [Rhizomicrobium sp.]
MAIIEKAAHGFGVFFPDLPGCTSFGATIEDAAANALVAAQAHVALSEEYGETPAPPRPLNRIPVERGVKEKARVLVPVETGNEAVRVNISLPASALAALDRTAKELSLTRSGAIVHLALSHESHRPRLTKAKRLPDQHDMPARSAKQAKRR